jgi:hypothetical protein
MNYGELRAAFEARLKRRDLAVGASADYIQLGLSRIQRTLRVPAMEATAVVTIDEDYDPDVGFEIPSDLLSLISVSTQHGSIRRTGIDEVLARLTETGVPRIFAQRGGAYILAPYPLDSDEIRIDYHAEFDALEDDEDDNFLSIIAPDLILYAALVYAADDFLDRRGERWAANYEALLQELQSQAAADELSSAVVSPTYFFEADNI